MSVPSPFSVSCNLTRPDFQVDLDQSRCRRLHLPCSTRSLVRGRILIALSQCPSNIFLSRTTVTIQNVHVPLGAVNINAYFQDTGLLGCSLVGRFEVFKPANQRNNDVVKISNFEFATFLI